MAHILHRYVTKLTQYLAYFNYNHSKLQLNNLFTAF